METIKETIKKAKGSLNVHRNRKALIIQALITSKFNTRKAMNLNYPEGGLKLDTYAHEVRSYFPEGLENLKERYLQEYNKCCVNEKRSINGDCSSCGAPAL